MSTPPLTVVPVPPPPPRKPAWPWAFRALLLLLLLDLLACNVFFLLGTVLPRSRFFSLGQTDGTIEERFLEGKTFASDKIAVIHIDGVLMETMTGFVRKQLDRAAGDSSVKAVVLRINSPGGTITASDDIHHRILELRDGNPEKKAAPKPVVVSMGSLAASGGYYIAMPARTIVAERTTLTGSIGVFAALPNIKELGDKIGFHMETIRAGDIKDSGSPFRNLEPKEREVWQAMIDSSYLHFLHVVEQGRPKLAGKLQEDLVIDENVPVRHDKERTRHVKMTRYRADGGIFTGEDALKYGLVDQIGYQEDAIKLAREAAGLGEEYRAVSYQRPSSFIDTVLGIRTPTTEPTLEISRLAGGAMPRLWYLAPEAELAGLLAASAKSTE
jgi:protease-4